MLKRDRQIRTGIHQFVDACLFAVALLLSYALRSNPNIIAWLKLGPTGQFGYFALLYLVLIPTAPFILESQGFYNHPPLCKRSAILWPLLKGCVFITLELALTAYVFHLIVARATLILFGCIGFCMLYLKEELIHLLFKSKVAQSQYKRRFILIGTERETAKIRQELKERSNEGIEIVAELNLLEIPVQQIVSTFIITPSSA